MAEVIRSLPGIGDACCVVRVSGRYFRVSTVDVLRYGGGSGVQTFAWPCDEMGRVTEWRSAAGGWQGRAQTIAEVVARYGDQPI